MGLQAQTWYFDILRPLFAGLDYVIYSLIKLILFGIFDLANLTTSSDLLNGIYTRIYVILGVFMAFKLSFSFFQYIIDPESMTGKSEKGVSKLISNIVIMLIALVAIPSILFSNNGGAGLIQRAQNAFLPMLPRLLLGISEDSGVSIGNGNNTDDITNAANVMAISSLQAFYAPAPKQELDNVCGSGTYDNTPSITSLNEFVSTTTLTCANGLSVNLGIVGSYGSPLYYKYSYSWGISTLVGILLVLMLAGITIDIAKRVFKMIILEAIAPIPIMSLIDPKSKKDGAFSHWLKSLISTFLDIFIKLGLLYLILTLIQLIVSKGLFENFPTFTDDPIRSSYLTVLLILGLIFFAKEAPKFIKDALGIKDSGAGMGTGMSAAMGALGGLIAGRGLSGMATGALAGATADPKVGGYAAGRDRAGQLRTGDPKWKGGFPATLDRWNANRVANRLGLSEANVNAADNYAKDLEQKAATAERAYQEALHSGVTGQQLSDLRDAADSAQFAATDARKNADKGKKDREALGAYNNSTSVSTRNADRRRHSAVRRAVGSVRFGSSDNFQQDVSDSDNIRKARTNLRAVEGSANNSDRGIFDPFKGANRNNLDTEYRDKYQRAVDNRTTHRSGYHNNNNNSNNNGNQGGGQGGNP